MAKSLDELIEYLLDEIAFSGNYGESNPVLSHFRPGRCARGGVVAPPFGLRLQHYTLNSIMTCCSR